MLLVFSENQILLTYSNYCISIVFINFLLLWLTFSSISFSLILTFFIWVTNWSFHLSFLIKYIFYFVQNMTLASIEKFHCAVFLLPLNWIIIYSKGFLQEWLYFSLTSWHGCSLIISLYWLLTSLHLIKNVLFRILILENITRLALLLCSWSIFVNILFENNILSTFAQCCVPSILIITRFCLI